jgi:hypothetical protein
MSIGKLPITRSHLDTHTDESTSISASGYARHSDRGRWFMLHPADTFSFTQVTFDNDEFSSPVGRHYRP